MHVEALVSSAVPWREHDLRVVLYARELGRLAAVARGARRASSRQAPALDPGTLIRCELVAGKTGWIITGAQAVRGWSTIKTSPLRWAACSFFLEAIGAMVYDGQPDEQLLDTITDSFSRLDTCPESEVPTVFHECQASFLSAMGYGQQSLGLDDECNRIAGRTLASLVLFRAMMAHHARGFRDISAHS